MLDYTLRSAKASRFITDVVVSTDDKETAKALKKANATDRKALEKERKGGQISLSFPTDVWARRLAAVDAMPDATLFQIDEKERALRDVLSEDAGNARFAQDAYVAAFLVVLFYSEVPWAGFRRTEPMQLTSAW